MQRAMLQRAMWQRAMWQRDSALSAVGMSRGECRHASTTVELTTANWRAGIPYIMSSNRIAWHATTPAYGFRVVVGVRSSAIAAPSLRGSEAPALTPVRN